VRHPRCCVRKSSSTDWGQSPFMTPVRSLASHAYVTVAGVVVAVALVVLVGGAGTASSQCLLAVEYHGETYFPVPSIPVRTGQFVGPAVIPGCNDHVNPDGTRPRTPDTPVNVYRAGSVAPAIALMTPRDSQIYVGQGFLPVLPSYPLHKAIFARVSHPPALECHRLTRLSGHSFGWPDLYTLGVQVSHHRGFFPVDGRTPLAVFLRESTSYAGSKYLGLPFIRPGARVQIAGAFCFRHLFFARSVRASNVAGSSASGRELAGAHTD
jgi:Family of unknown function (DUF6281)